MRKRTRSRELALQFLYTLEVRGPAAMDDLDEFLKESKASQLHREYVMRLLNGVQKNKSTIDGHIQDLAENWDLKRIALVDRNILRLGSFEILYSQDVPASVAINEAVELGKRYSTKQSGGFINGILDRMQSLRTNGNPS